MSVYTISPCLIRQNKKYDLDYIRSVLFVFLNGDHKVAKDANGRMIDIYDNLPDSSGIIHIWLTLMSYEPSRFEKVSVDLDSITDEEEMCLKLCKETKGAHKMIVYSIQSMKCEIDENYCTTKEGIVIKLYDRDTAKDELAPQKTVNKYHLQDTIIAGGNVTNSNNNK